MLPETPEASSGGEGLIIEFPEGEAPADAASLVEEVASEPLSAARQSELLNRLPAFEAEPDPVPFQKRLSSRPAPRPGETVDLPFPNPEEASPPQSDPQPSGPLKILRYSPEGDVALAPGVSITFSQPMVPVSGHDDLKQKPLPIRMEPEVEGTWRWVGTQTLIFDSETRLPMATRYTMTIPQGTQSETGGRLEEAFQWQFSTAPVEPVAIWPRQNSVLGLEPVFLMRFNQAISREAMLDSVALIVDGGAVGLRLVDKAEWVSRYREEMTKLPERGRLTGPNTTPESVFESLIKGQDGAEDRWFAFAPTRKLEPAKSVRVQVGVGAPSAEGPLQSVQVVDYSFSTYDKLALRNTNWDRRKPRPNQSLSMQFNNDLDEKAFRAEWVRITPAVDDLNVRVRRRNVMLEGSFKAKTRYRIEIGTELKDVYGQTLERAIQRECVIDELVPELFWGLPGFYLSDPFQPATVEWMNHNMGEVEVAVYRVDADDWGVMSQQLANRWNRAGHLDPPGEKVLAEKRVLDAEARLSGQKQSLDLSDFYEDGAGQLVVTVKPVGASAVEKKGRRFGSELVSWVQRTEIGLTAFSGSEMLHVWATDLKDGQPLAGTVIEVRDVSSNRVIQRGEADRNGLAAFSLDNLAKTGPHVIVATLDGDTAILPESPTSRTGDRRWFSPNDWSRIATYLTDGRGLYRPGEKVQLKGWVRWLSSKRGNHPEMPSLKSIRYRVLDSRRSEIAKGTTEVTALGGLNFEFEIPDDANLGMTAVFLEDAQPNQRRKDEPLFSQTFHMFQIQEFRRPEYSVSVDAPTGPHKVGDTLSAEVTAAYYAGGGLADAPVRWDIQTRSTHYAPPGWSGFSFGEWIPWWRSIGRPETFATYQKTGITDGNGKDELRLHFQKATSAVPHSCQVTAAVRDVNAQEWQASTQFLVHSGEVYVGLRTKRYFVEKGVPFALDIIAANIDDKAVPGASVDIRVTRRTYDANWQAKEVEVAETSMTSSSQPVLWEFPTTEGGQYTIKAIVRDGNGGENQTTVTRWVTGGSENPNKLDGLGEVSLVPNQESYQPGDVAEILVQAPFSPAEGMAVVRQYDVASITPIQFEGQTATIRVPISEDHIPNLTVQVEVVGNSPGRTVSGTSDPDLPPQPAHATGQINLRVPPLKRSLQVQLTPEAPAVQPGATVKVNVKVSGAGQGSAANAEVAVIVVDEALLALSGFELGDPLSVFYPEIYGPMQINRLREMLQKRDTNGNYAMDGMVVKDFATMRMDRAPMAAPMMESKMADTSTGGGAPIEIRRDFNPVAAFLPNLKTDGSGHLTATIELPDNLTRYRIMAIAASGETMFGTGEAHLTARLPLMLRPSPPRFLNYGDHFELPFVIQNQTESAMTIDLVARTQNLALTETGGRRFTLEPGVRREVRIPAASVSAGTARVQAAVFAGDTYDAAEVAWPVWTPATTEAFATYGVVDEGSVAQRVVPPAQVFDAFGGLEITTSSTALQGLTDAVMYLVNYPFGCSEQLSSRVLAIAALRDVLDAFGKDLDAGLMEKRAKEDLTRLASLQNRDGGFGFWRRNEKSWPFLTAHVAHAMVRAEEKGFEIPNNTLGRALEYLKDVERHYEKTWKGNLSFSMSAYALHVRRLAGDLDSAKATRILESLPFEEAPMEGLGWLLPCLDLGDRDRVLGFINNRISETAATAQITSRYQDQSYLILHSRRRDDAVVLESLIEVDPDNDVIVKLVRGLMAGRVKGRWQSTQENVFVLLAMDRYFQTFEAETPQFLAQVWLGDQYAGDQRFSGRETVRRNLDVPMKWLLNQGPTELLLAKEGEGRLYYRLGLKYAPSDLKLEPASHGFHVKRSYSAVDDPEDVVQGEDGRVIIKRGARVRVELTMVAPARRYHVALVDPLPAGLEPMNPAISGNEPPAKRGAGTRPWSWTWYGHQNMRDERVEAFSTQVYSGSYEYAYIARATTPGVFVVPPTKAEEMYHPETFGRGASALVEVR